MNVTFFDRAPNGPLQYLRYLSGVLLVLSLAACGSGPTSTEQGKEEGHDRGEHPGGSIEVGPEQFAAIDGELGRVEMKDLATSLQATGFLKVPPQNIADVSAAMPATVREISVQEGDHVRKGQTLVMIADQAIARLQRDYLDARARLTYAQADLERQTELARTNVSAQKTLQQATAEHASLLANVRSDEQVLRLWGIDPGRLTADDIRTSISVPSPIEGTVAHIGVNVGSRVGGEVPMVRVVDNSELHVDVFVYEQDITRVKQGQTIDLVLTNVPGRSYTAEVFAIGSAFESETKTLPVHARITGDKSGLIDGMGVTAMIDVGNAKVPAVPTGSIVSNNGNDYVFLHTEAEEGEGNGTGSGHAGMNTKHEANKGHDHSGPMHFQRVQVKRGATQGGYTAITFLQPVPPDAEVVTGGAFYLMSMMVNTGGHEH